MKTGPKFALSSLVGLVALGFILFLPAGTFDYWQAWVFIAVFTAGTILPSAYLARTDPAALRRRMRGGPLVETRMVQKFVIVGAFASIFGMIAFSAYDHRMGWSRVPPWVCVVGDVLIVVGLVAGVLVVVQNRYAAAAVRVEAGQTVASRGLYGIVRHPMYAANLVLMVGMPLALGSYWGVLFLIPNVLVLALRILDEENLLTRELPGYPEYTEKVRYRLIPYVW
jgi:protein-S-isoprenylcysteine O-methyltransferase Ste14